MHEVQVGVSDPQTVWSERLDSLLATLKSREKGILFGAVVFQVLVLLSMIISHAIPLATGDTILLRVIPVDPRDLFRGDYVILSYGEMSRMMPKEIGAQNYNNWREYAGRTVYVSLVPDDDGKHWNPTEASLNRPARGRFICGRIDSWNRIEFGIESYFVEEGKGRDIERAIRDKKVSAEVALTADGKAALKGLNIEP